MKNNIKIMNEHLVEYENLFYDRINDLKNSMNKCDCKKSNTHCFCNIKCIKLLCIECGGYVDK